MPVTHCIVALCLWATLQHKGKATLTAARVVSTVLHHSRVVSHCSSNYICRPCKGRHHTLLHKEDSPAAPPAMPTLIATPAAMDKTVGVEPVLPAKAAAADLPIRRGFVLTALMTLCFGDRKVVIRAGLDTCSGSSMVSERIASMLHVKRHSTHLDMSGLVSDTTIKQYCTLNISTALPSDFDLELSMAIASRIPDSTPPPNIQSVLNNSMNASQLDTLGGKIDVLISTGDLSYFLLPDHVRICPHSGLTAVSTVFGWSLMGRLKDDDQVTMMRVELVRNETHLACTKLWELEKVPQADKRTPEERSAVKQLQQHLSCKQDGRYSVRLPRVEDPPKLGDSRRMVLSRFYGNEKKLQRHNQLQPFRNEMDSYFKLDHAEVVPKEDLLKPHYYMPVHGIVKDSSTTTRMRPVFDASATTTTGNSFNDQLLPSPSLYPFVLDLLLQFRLHPIAMSADIGKMFRQIHLAEEERDFHRFLIRNSQGSI